MTRRLKLYVWEDTLSDYTSGVMFAYARNVKEAREQVLAACHYVPKGELETEPAVYEAPIGFAVWGGG